MKFENTAVMNFQGAFRGLRNPLESWLKSDSSFGIDDTYSIQDYEVAHKYCEYNNINFLDAEEYEKKSDFYASWLRENGIIKWSNNHDYFEYAYIGPKDLDLAQRMISAGSSDRKFLRQIFVSVDVTAPLYWWKQADTYKIGTVSNSTSTMHKLATTPISINCFETEDYEPDLILYPNNGVDPDFRVREMNNNLISHCETLRKKYQKTKNKRYWKELIRILPNGWLQKRTWTANYEILRNIYSQRKHHKLTEWHSFCKWIETLPYSKELITYNLFDK